MRPSAGRSASDLSSLSVSYRHRTRSPATRRSMTTSRSAAEIPAASSESAMPRSQSAKQSGQYLDARVDQVGNGDRVRRIPGAEHAVFGQHQRADLTRLPHRREQTGGPFDVACRQRVARLDDHHVLQGPLLSWRRAFVSGRWITAAAGADPEGFDCFRTQCFGRPMPAQSPLGAEATLIQDGERHRARTRVRRPQIISLGVPGVRFSGR